MPNSAIRFRRCELRALLAGIACALWGCTHHGAPVFARQLEAERASAALHLDFTKAADAANRAVMATSSQGAETYAREAQANTEAAQRDLGKLSDLVQGLGYPDEIALVAQFRSAFTQYRALDAQILSLAVQNTNHKAQQLSFGPDYQAANTLNELRDTVTRVVTGKQMWHARALAASTMLAVREIEVLQGPHIAASEDGVMTEIEQHMAALEASARADLRELAALDLPDLHDALTKADAALTQFMSINAQIVALSRRNSDVVSLALSLGKKRMLAAACEARLEALRVRLAKYPINATR